MQSWGMPLTITRIAPDLPLCWEDEHTLRFGFDEAALRLRDPSATQQRIIRVLLDGVRDDRVRATLTRLGTTSVEWTVFLGVLAPVLQRVPCVPDESGARRGSRQARSRPAGPAVSVLGDGASAEAFRGACARLGLPLLEPNAPPIAGPALAIVFERFLLRGREADALSDAGLPQLPVRFGDRRIGIGPLVSEQSRPCPNCVRLADFAADPALPVLAAQLVERRPPTETVAGAEAAGALAAALIRRWWNGSAEPGTTRYEIPFADGLPAPVVERRSYSPHPECGCRLIAPATTPPPR